jgi:hypothetical protein
VSTTNPLSFRAISKTKVLSNSLSTSDILITFIHRC